MAGDRDPNEELARIRELADQVVAQLSPLSDIPFGFTRESVAWVEGFIERQRTRRDPADGAPTGLVNALGAFLGECLIRATGGAWEEEFERWGVRFPIGAMAFPFAKVEKQFEAGVEGGDSILSFYDVGVNYIATGAHRSS